MTIATDLLLFPVNTNTMDTSGGPDVRRLNAAESGADDSTQGVNATHTQDNQFRTWNPANTGQTANLNPLSVLRSFGWALRLYDDMTPPSYLSPDISNSKNHAIIVGAASMQAAISATFGNRLGLNSGSTALDGCQGARSKDEILLASLTDFTMECKVSRTRTTVIEEVMVLGELNSGVYDAVQCYFNTSGTLTVDFFINGVNSGSIGVLGLGVGEYDLAVERYNGTLYAYVNGVMSGSVAMPALPNGSVPLWIGRAPSLGGGNVFPLLGAVDEVRLSNFARYRGASYTPATEPFVNDNGTLILWHLDQIERPCVCILPAQTIEIGLRVTVNQTGGTYVSGTYAPDIRGSLWAYNPTTRTGRLISNFSNASALSWDLAPVGGDLGTAKDAVMTANVAADFEFLPGEIFYAQFGLATLTIPNPSVGTATFTYVLTVDNPATYVELEQALELLCAEVIEPAESRAGLVPKNRYLRGRVRVEHVAEGGIGLAGSAEAYAIYADPPSEAPEPIQEPVRLTPMPVIDQAGIESEVSRYVAAALEAARAARAAEAARIHRLKVRRADAALLGMPA